MTLFKNKYFRFCTGLIGIFLFVVVVPQVYRYNDQYRSFEMNVEKEGIDVNALFYTEEDATAEAERDLRHIFSSESKLTNE